MNRQRKILMIFMLSFSFLILNSCQSVVRFSSKAERNVSFTGSSLENKTYEKSDIRGKVLRIAEDWIGTPYCWGGESKKCADCSGFVQSVFASAGIELPRVSREQYNASVKISKINAKPGDLVFFAGASKIDHVGIYSGDNTMIHSSSSYGVIRQSLNAEYYKKRFAGFGRVIESEKISCDYD